MISINIPVYNIDARPLVLQLVNQVEALPFKAEIRIYDDNSEESFKKLNRQLRAANSVIYTELEKNIGRSAIRNKMGEDSTFEYLLFIDADSEILSADYLEIYIENIKNKSILCGGTVYHSIPPDESSKFLRWFYGSKREAISAEKRNNKKGFIITSNNFCIEKKLFLKTRFREDIGKYGHEDTLLGFDLHKKGVTPFHINNLVKHTGLEGAEVFLKKTLTAVENLHFISKELLENDSDFERQVNFLNRYKNLTAVIPDFLLPKLFPMFRNKLEKNLMGEKPRLVFYDLYKLLYYATLKAKT